MPKRTLRQLLLVHRRGLSVDVWHAASNRAQQLLLDLDAYARAAVIALYAPVHHETDTAMIRDMALAQGKQVVYPAISGHHMILRQVQSPDQFQRGGFGIPEPGPGAVEYRADQVDLIVVPGVAFASDGHRIGYGKGYYDRFLQHPGRRAVLVGLCHDFQVLEDPFPADPHDIRMDLLVTEKRVITCGVTDRQGQQA